jgi:hypothetical protein
MWDIRRHVRRLPSLPDNFVVRFHFPDAREGKRLHWLVFDPDDIDLCYTDPGFEVDVHIEAPLQTMTRIWIGAESLDTAVACRRVHVDGPDRFTATVTAWLGLGELAAIPKRSAELRIIPPIQRAS